MNINFIDSIIVILPLSYRTYGEWLVEQKQCHHNSVQFQWQSFYLSHRRKSINFPHYRDRPHLSELGEKEGGFGSHWSCWLRVVYCRYHPHSTYSNQLNDAVPCGCMRIFKNHTWFFQVCLLSALPCYTLNYWTCQMNDSWHNTVNLLSWLKWH